MKALLLALGLTLMTSAQAETLSGGILIEDSKSVNPQGAVVPLESLKDCFHFLMMDKTCKFYFADYDVYVFRKTGEFLGMIHNQKFIDSNLLPSASMPDARYAATKEQVRAICKQFKL